VRQYVDVVDPVLSSIEAVTQHCQQTLSAIAAAAADSDTDAYFHTLEASSCSSYSTVMLCISRLDIDPVKY